MRLSVNSCWKKKENQIDVIFFYMQRLSVRELFVCFYLVYKCYKELPVTIC